jgi:hypothetical protein
LRGVCHRRNGVLLRDCGRRRGRHRTRPRRPPRSRPSHLPTPCGQAAALADTAPPRVPWVSRPTNPLAGWHVSRHVPSRASRHSTPYPGFGRASRGSAAGARSRLAAIPRPQRIVWPTRRSAPLLTPRHFDVRRSERAAP